MPDLKLVRTMVVTDPIGLHARTAVGVADVVRRSQSTVTLMKDDRRASGTEVLQMLSLVVYPGESVVVQAVGPDAAAVLDALAPIMAGDFDDQAQKNA